MLISATLLGSLVPGFTWQADGAVAAPTAQSANPPRGLTQLVLATRSAALAAVYSS